MTQLDLQQRLEQAEAERRTTACVNAFDGIPTERIEGKDLGQILAGELRLHGAGSRTDGGFGFEFSGGLCQLLAEAYADQFRESGAVNYLELLFNHTEIGPLTITMQRVEGLTPAQKLAKAEAERDALKQQVDEYSRILDGLPKDAIDGGWTAKGISDYAAKMERQVDALAAAGRGARDVMLYAANNIAYAIFNLSDKTLANLKPGLSDTTCPTDSALLAERELRNFAAKLRQPERLTNEKV